MHFPLMAVYNNKTVFAMGRELYQSQLLVHFFTFVRGLMFLSGKHHHFEGVRKISPNPCPCQFAGLSTRITTLRDRLKSLRVARTMENGG